MKFVYEKLLFTLLMLAAVISVAASEQHWKINKTSLMPHDEFFRKLIVNVSEPSRLKEFELTAKVVLTTVDSYSISGDKLVLLGQAGRSQAVVILDLKQGKEIDWFFCYEPQLVSRNWIAYVEFYPSHGSDYPTDVVMIYDLSKDPIENRMHATGHLAMPPGRFDRPVQVGIPVYPEANASQGSYINAVRNEQEVKNVLGPPFFLMLANHRLLFLSYTGQDFSNYYNHLVVVDLSKGLLHPEITTVEIPKDQLKKPGENPNFVKATGMKEVSPDEVRLFVPKSEYGVDSVLVKIPD